MQSMQQTVFKNIGQSTIYNYDQKKFTQKHSAFPKHRQQEIQNQFELVDLHSRGTLTQKQILTYLGEKYEWVNSDILKQIFKTMKWEDGAVSKPQFTHKYLERQKKLYHEINGLKFYSTWTRTLEDIFNQQMRKGKPRAYFFTQIKSIQLFHEGKAVQWMDLKIQYENHQSKLTYEIQQSAHEASHPSFQIWLPSQKNNFFLTFKFVNIKSQQPYGQCYININLQERMEKTKNLQVEITKSGKKVGSCQIVLKAQSSISKVQEHIKQAKDKTALYSQIVDDKIKEYQYLQFLWGIKHRSPHKITHVDATWMLILRTIFIVLLGVLGLIVHVLGRCQPISLIVAFMLLKNREHILLRNEKFMLTWLVLSSILMDVIWVVVSSDSQSQINFTSLETAETLTYLLLVVKACLFGYLLFFEKAFDDSN